jgi:hypothetical protein
MMIIASITGGLGNQLFQYAMARRLAIHRGTELLLNTSGFGSSGEQRRKELHAFARRLGLFQFHTNARVAAKEEVALLRDDFHRSTIRDRAVRQVRRHCYPRFLWKGSHIVERQYRFEPKALNFPDNVYLEGYWQSPKYFDDIAPLIRAEFRPLDTGVVQSANDRICGLRQAFGRVVSLHVRRGDLAHAYEVLGRKDLTYGGPVGLEYIHAAIQQFDPEACFYVFSDSARDIAWCRENVHARHLEFSSAESEIWDLIAMSSCDDHIIANSTFSWWAAWLDEKPGRRVIAPRIWSSPEARLPIVIDDLLPVDWELI